MADRDRGSMKERLLKRLTEGGSGGGRGILKPGADVKTWNPNESTHIIDILPYFAGPNDPIAKEGEETYVLEVYVHQNVGVQEGMILCLAETYGKKCPICEDRKIKQRKGADEKIIKGLTPSRYPRTLYYVLNYDSREEEKKGPQVFHTSFYMLEMHLREMAKRASRPGQKGLDPYIPFMDLKEGRSIVFKREGKGTSTKFNGIRFEDRDYDLPESLIKDLKPLDELIYIPTYEEVERFYYGDDGEADGRRSERDVPRHVEGEDTGRRRREPEAEEDTGRRKREPAAEEDSGRRRREPDGGEEGGRRRREPAEEDKGNKDKLADKDKSECPEGFKFGEEVDEHKQCRKCDVWEDCTKRSAELKVAARKAEKDKGEAEEDKGGRRRAASEGEEDKGGRRRRGADDDGSSEKEKPAEEGTRRRRRGGDDD